MADKSKSSETPVELWRKIASSREAVGRDLGGLRYELDFPLKFKKTFQRHTVIWIGVAVAAGLLVALLRTRTKKIYVNRAGKKVRSPEKSLLESGALLGAVKLALTVLQPMVVSHFAKKGAKKGERSRSGAGR
jgi:hypothetical protein